VTNRASPQAAQPLSSSATGLSPLARRDTILILVCIAFITALAWLYLIHLDRQMAPAMAQDAMMAAMGMAMNKPWTMLDIFFTFTMWAVMMVGMMSPSAAPMILLFAGTQSERGKRRVLLSAGTFALGYAFVWIVFSAGAALVQWALHQTALLSPAMTVLSPRIGGAVLIAAGIYQMTPWKNGCLTHCRSPLSFLMTHWSEGKWGAFRIGARHGAYCLGCCWALMAILFVVGVMNLVWVAALAGFVLLEKVGPYGPAIARISGAALMIYGIVLIA
jgi:predicted metal-binding membrane protein